MQRFLPLLAAAAACGSGPHEPPPPYQPPVDAPPALGEVCSTAERIELVGGMGMTTVSATTESYSDDYSSASCGTPGADRVFVVNVPAGGRLVATLRPTVRFAAQYMYLFEGAACGGPQQCRLAEATGPGDLRRAVHENTGTTAVDIYLLIDTIDTGSFDLDILVDPIPSPPPGDICERAEPVTFTDGMATLSGSLSLLSGYRSDYPDCVSGFNRGLDRVYEVTVPPGFRIQGTLSATFGASLSFLGGPAAACDEVCLGGAQALGTLAFVRYDNMTGAPRVVFVAVDKPDALRIEGEYRVDLRLGATPPGETCAEAETIDVSSGSALVDGTMVSYVNHYAPTCAGFPTTGPDHFYNLSIPAQHTLTATVTPASSLYDPGLYLIEGPATNCTAAATCLAADNTHGSGMADSLTYTNPGNTPIDVLLGIDGGTAYNEGPYSLAITVAP